MQRSCVFPLWRCWPEGLCSLSCFQKVQKCRATVKGINPLQFGWNHLADLRDTWVWCWQLVWLEGPFFKENQAKNVLSTFSKQALKIFRKTDNLGMSVRQRNREIRGPILTLIWTLLLNPVPCFHRCPALPSQPPKGMADAFVCSVLYKYKVILLSV